MTPRSTGVIPVLDHLGEITVWNVRGADQDPVPRYYLQARIGGVVQPLPIASRTVPFDVDLGTRGGRPVAAYSRCAEEPTPERVLEDAGRHAALVARPYPVWVAGRGCDLFEYDFATRRERKLEGASTSQASEVLPSVSGDRVGFARVYEQRDGARGAVPYLYVRRGGRDSERIPGGGRGALGLPGPTRVDLDGRELAFVWNRATSARDGATTGVSELRVGRVGAPTRQLSRAAWGTPQDRGYASYVGPQVAGGRVTYAFQRGLFGEAAAQPITSLLLSRTIGGGRSVLAAAPPFVVDASTDDDETWVGVDRVSLDTLGRDAHLLTGPVFDQPGLGG